MEEMKASEEKKNKIETEKKPEQKPEPKEPEKKPEKKPAQKQEPKAQDIRNLKEKIEAPMRQLTYQYAIDVVLAKLRLIDAQLSGKSNRPLVRTFSSRIKTTDSIVKKLKRYGHETSIENMVRYVNDIAGVRLICSFTSDIYRLAEMIGNQSDLKVLSIKDYIKNPKESGYKSYHMLVSVPIFLSDSVVDTKVEIQIRTIAMDFWASLEHKIYYKFEGNAPEYISRDLQECAKMVSELDDKMLSLNEAIQECIAQQDKDQIQMNEELMNGVCRDVLGNNKEYKDPKVQEKVTEIVT